MFRARMRRLLLLVFGGQAFVVLLYIQGAFPYQEGLSRRLTDLMDAPLNLYRSSETALDIAGQKAVIKQRKDHIQLLCNNLSNTDYWSKLKPTGSVWTVDGVNYCITPKAGCTFWKRGFRFLGRPGKKLNSTKIKKPSDINRISVHYGGLSSSVKVTKMSNSSITDVFATNKSFMFARHPFDRLWSAYIDKFLLPDYWQSSAVAIARYSRPESDVSGITCFNDITFQEYLNSIAFGRVMNEHWAPVHKLCNPCHVTFDVIGKIETFNIDTEYIIDRYHLEEMKEEQTKDERIKNEIDMLIKYNFHIKSWFNSKDCYQPLNVAERLWLAFQLNGYIHTDMKFPESALLKLGFLGNPVNVLSAVVEVMRKKQTAVMKKTLKNQKRSVMLNTYKKMPKETIDALREIYKYDFLMFQYDDYLNFN